VVHNTRRCSQMNAQDRIGSDDPLDEYIAKFTNWGRWGADDQCGTANLITPASVRDACRAVEAGTVVSLGIGFDQRGPQTGANGRFNCLRYSTATGTDHATGNQLWSGQPFPREMGYCDDVAMLPLQSATHWDSLSHILHRGRMYNGFPAGDVTAAGAARNGVEHLADRLVGRGVLLDFPRTKGVSWLDDGYAITAADLDEAVAAAQAEVREGDILLLRTGQLSRCREQGWQSYAGGGAPGLSFFTLPWLHDHGIGAVASDTWGVEVRPNELPASFQPFHIVAIVYMGLILGEMFDLERLADLCATQGRSDVLIAASPLAFTGAAGAPPGPVAIL
jgi:kynurenine formamidase